MAPISRSFFASLHAFAEQQHLPLVRFRRGGRKEDIAATHLARFAGDEGVLLIGIAQKKTRVFRTERRHNPRTGAAYPWLVPGSAMVNQYYRYALDRDFGPFFIKFSSYFPHTRQGSERRALFRSSARTPRFVTFEKSGRPRHGARPAASTSRSERRYDRRSHPPSGPRDSRSR